MRVKLQRSLSAALTVTALLWGATLQSATIQWVEPQFITTGEFQRISEFFTGKENTSGRAILRTQADERDGLYFIIKLDTPASQFPDGASLKLDLVTTARKDVITYTLPINSSQSDGRTMLVGFTGSDWRGPGIRPLAWHVTLVDAKGATLTEHKSFLWEMP
ncbi:MAG: hypothetical protein SFY80_03405 [Verrucomicrobiota bacterium]|nr:hypothetical protein [Verrucomicrobiota bacterium]